MNPSRSRRRETDLTVVVIAASFFPCTNGSRALELSYNLGVTRL
jgi:hypothetical protein